MKNKKYKYQTIEVIREKIRLDKMYWSIDEIYELLKEIEKEKNFKGFVKLYFEVGEIPEITIYKNVPKSNK